MTDQTIPADKVRTWVNSWETTRPEHRTLEDAEGIIQALRDMLPPPPHPTLADIPPEERDKCKWMQADTANGARVTILRLWNGLARVVNKRGFVLTYEYAEVTPRPDLRRMTWPGDTSEPDEEGDTND